MEKARFFNQPHANADISFWSKAAYWTLEEAIALSFGKNPELVNWDRLKGMQFESPFVEKYRKLRDLAFRAKWIEKLYDPVLPSIYLQWIKENKLEFPEHLESALVAHAGAFFDWKANYDQLFAIYEFAQGGLEKDCRGLEGPSARSHPRTRRSPRPVGHSAERSDRT